ncbi:MAG TPA: hypothetical protein VFG68_18825 [Fimbriiglobus sp.]|nr:hypothetical protein [Fimbriiglobus sp.]
MITGSVNAVLEPIVSLTIHDAGGHPYQVDVVIDTAFNDELTLPPAVIATLGLNWQSTRQAQFADGTVQPVDVFTAAIIWDGQPRAVRVFGVDSKPLLGLRMLADSELRIEVHSGGSVTIQPIP